MWEKKAQEVNSSLKYFTGVLEALFIMAIFLSQEGIKESDNESKHSFLNKEYLTSI